MLQSTMIGRYNQQITATRGVQSPPLEAVIEEITLPNTESSISRIISLTEKAVKRHTQMKEAGALPYSKVNTKNAIPKSSRLSAYNEPQPSPKLMQIMKPKFGASPEVNLAPAIYYRTRTSFLREKKSAAKTSSSTSTISRPSISSATSSFKKSDLKSKRTGISESRPLLPQIRSHSSSSKESLTSNHGIYKMVYNLEQGSHDLFYLNSILEDRWIVTEKIRSGNHIQIYKAYDKSLEKEVIIKATDNRNYSLHTESALLRALESRENILKYIAHEEKARIPFLVAELEGPNFEDIKKCYGPLSINTVINIGMRMLDAIEKLHARGWVHTNITPSSFTIGNHPHKWRHVTLNDYGLSRRAVRGQISAIAPENKIGMFSDPHFASISALNGREFDKRDDLWSLVFVLLYLKSERLPWSLHSDINVVRDSKQSFTDDAIVRHLGATFKKMTLVLNNLKYGERPDYTKITNVFMKVKRYYTLNALDKFEWETNPDKLWVVKDSSNAL